MAFLSYADPQGGLLSLLHTSTLWNTETRLITKAQVTAEALILVFLSLLSNSLPACHTVPPSCRGISQVVQYEGSASPSKQTLCRALNACSQERPAHYATKARTKTSGDISGQRFPKA